MDTYMITKIGYEVNQSFLYRTIAFGPVCVAILICHHELFAPMDQRYSHDHNGSAEYGNQSFLYRTIAFVPVCVAILICHHELFVPMDQ